MPVKVGAVFAHDRIKERAFARVGLARDHHPDALAQQGPLAGALQDGLHLFAQTRELALRIGLLVLAILGLTVWEAVVAH